MFSELKKVRCFWIYRYGSGWRIITLVDQMSIAFVSSKLDACNFLKLMLWIVSL